jgi:hypothetical protein
MAASPAVRQEIEARLREIEAEAAFLPELEAGWQDENPGARTDWLLEWTELFSRLSALERERQQGALSEEQVSRLRRLVKDLQTHSGFFELMGLSVPTTLASSVNDRSAG